ncbi:hypothetical protein NtRootA9_01470 [Arthrobacter sp. NtRootA9]|nr:hypothetical protein NtRootA9_01470 [Arthrobacter sp. NtRootA9]
MCVLLALLVASAAAYTHGTRYALIGHDTQESAPAPVSLVSAPQSATPSPNPDTLPAPAQGGKTKDQETGQNGCCERRPAPRSEPAPIRIDAADPPATAPRNRSAGVVQHAPPEPDLPTLTVVSLSVSRT